MTPLERAWIAYGGILPTGRSTRAHCPLHEDHRASARVDIERGKWRCFAGCGHGDVYDLIGFAENEPEFLRQVAIANAKFGTNAQFVRGKRNDKKRPGRKGEWVPPWLR